MKLNSKISERIKKAAAILLLFYFVSSPLLLAFPPSQCVGSCEMATDEMHTCAMEMLEDNHDCCNSDMDFSFFGNSSCDMEFTYDNCMIVTELSKTNNFVITPKFNSEQSFVVIFTFNLTSDRNEFLTIEITDLSFKESKTPIYLSVQSFLN